MCLILTQSGIGYRIILGANSAAALPAVGENAAFYTYMGVREDAIELYGFETFEEREAFEILKSINKVGSRTALSILSQFRPQELYDIVMNENLSALMKVSGIGKKTAQHILLELRYKLKSQAHGNVPPRNAITGVAQDIQAALGNLGYSEEECGGIVRAIVKEEPDIDLGSGIRKALKELAKKNE